MKRFFFALCLFSMLLAVLVLPVSAAGLAGSGTKSDPYRISGASDLKQIASYLNKSGVYFQLTKDISLSGGSGWTPLGTEKKPFKGILDGAGHTVSGLTFQNGSDQNECLGLFAYADGAEFRRLRITDVTFDCPEIRQAGALAAVAENCVFKDCDASVRCEQGATYFGGLAGYATSSSFEDCDVSVDTKASGYSGGMAGYLHLPAEGNICAVRNCSAQGSIAASGQYIGGLIGRIAAEAESVEQNGEYIGEKTYGHTVSGCITDVSVQSAGTGNMTYVGGLFGSAECLDISDCRALGDIKGKGGWFGGLIGEYEGGIGSVTRCSAAGDLESAGTGYGAFVGGLIGWSRGARISDCFSTGSVTADSTWSDCQDSYMAQGRVWVRYRNPAGALIGLLHFSYGDTKFYLSNCFASGTVTNPNACLDDRSYCAGALVGYVYDDLMRKYILDKSKADQTDLAGFSDTVVGKLENNYCLSELRTYFIPQSDAERYGNGYRDKYQMPHITYVQNISAEQLTSKSAFAGFDFNTVWTMTDAGPELVWKGTALGGQTGTDPDPDPPVQPVIIPDDKGDLNGDGAVDAVDYILLKKSILSGSYKPEDEAKLDVNTDGDVDARDYIVLKKFVLAGGR